MTKLLLAQLVAATLAALCMPAYADIHVSRGFLRPLHHVRVSVETLESSLTNYGITSDDLQTRIELRLRTAGIHVLDSEAVETDANTPYLYLRISSIAIADHQIVAYSLDLNVQQSVGSLGTHRFVGLATTWEAKGSIGYAGTGVVVENIYGAVDRALDEFVNAWLAAHPNPAR